MKGIAVVGSVTNGHNGYPSVQVVTGSDFVSCNGIAVATVGSKCSGHDKSHGTYHVPVVSGGSDFVSIDGIAVAMIGSPVEGGGCSSGHVIVTGDDTVQISQ